MTEHPVRLTVTDDLRRSRLTILFRVLLALPHFVWWWLWTVAAVLAGVANWFATFVRGRPPDALHRFLTAYVRYSTHFFSYLFLAANPYPGFTGEPGYPVDVELGEPEPQRRWVTGLRIFLIVPALLLSAVFQGAGYASWYGADEARGAWGGGTFIVVAVLGWFVCVALGRMPRGFRDLQVYGLRYLAQAAAYGLVLTERYPNVDPAASPASGPEHPVRLRVGDDLRRSRLTVFFRLLLALPHFVWLVLWWVAAVFAAFINWVTAVIIGRPPAALHRFLSAFLRYSTHVSAYVALTANPFPGFTGTAGSYPVDPELPPPERQHRLVTLFRLFLWLPALLVSGALNGLFFVAAFLGWFASLALGRMPRSLREAQVYALRYSVQGSAFLLLITDRYPFSGPALGSPEPEPEREPPDQPPPAEAPAVA